MAIFKKNQKKMDAVTTALEIVAVVFKQIRNVLKAISALFTSIRLVVKVLRGILNRLLVETIKLIRKALAKVGRLAGPLKFITKLLNEVLRLLETVVKPIEEALKNLSDKMKIFSEGIRQLKATPEYKAISTTAGKLLKRVQQINELAKLLEKQQDWIEKAFPTFVKKVEAQLEALTKPIEEIKKIGKKIGDAIKEFANKITGYQKTVDELYENVETLRKWLSAVKKVANALLRIIEAIEALIKTIPFVEYIIDLLKYIGAFINEVIRRSGIRGLLDDMIKNNEIMKIVLAKVNGIAEAIETLLKDFKEIWNDVIKLAKEIFDLRDILKNLHGLLRMIAAIKWLLEFRFPNILKKMREALEKMKNPEFRPLTLFDSSSLVFIVETVTIDGQGIGNDWIIHITINDETYDINVESEANTTIQLSKQVFEETVSNQQQGFERSIHIAATELDPVYNDHGGMETPQIVQINPEQSEQTITLSFVVNASGGDSGAEATITVQLKMVLAEIENVVLPLSNAGANNDAINYLEHAINDLRNDMVKYTLVPGLYANMYALDQFVNEAELLLNKLKVLVMELPDDQEQKEQLITEFYNLIAASEAQITPERADQFDGAYYIELENTLEIIEEPEEETIDIFAVGTDDFCLCDDASVLDIIEAETITEDITSPLDDFDIYAYINSLDFKAFDDENE